MLPYCRAASAVVALGDVLTVPRSLGTGGDLSLFLVKQVLDQMGRTERTVGLAVRKGKSLGKE